VRALADTARRIAAAAPARSPVVTAARRLVKILADAASPEAAREAAWRCGDPAVLRLFDAAEARTAAAALENVAWQVEDAWLRLQVAAVSSVGASDVV
jgi:hypothetical protein